MLAFGFSASFATFVSFIIMTGFSTNAVRQRERVLRIGGLFDTPNLALEEAMNKAMREVNARTSRMFLKNITSRLRWRDSFEAQRKTCQMIKKNALAIFGPQSLESRALVRSICDSMAIPHLETSLDYNIFHEGLSINLHPPLADLGRAFADLISQFEWRSMTVIYQKNEGLIRLQEILHSVPEEINKNLQITVRQLTGEDHRPLLKEIKKSLEKHIVLDADAETSAEVLKKAQEMDMVTMAHHYLLTSMDVLTVDLSDKIRRSGANITFFTMVPTLENIIKPDSALNHVLDFRTLHEIRQGTSGLVSGNGIKLETALIYDGILLLSQALKKYFLHVDLYDLQLQYVNCESGGSWEHGSNLINYFKKVQLEGITGPIMFKERGKRCNYTLNVMEFGRGGREEKVGTWTIDRMGKHNLTITKTYEERTVDTAAFLNGTKLRVTSILEPPYLMLKTGTLNKDAVGNKRFEGYCVELMDAIITFLKESDLTRKYVSHLDYEIHLVEDGNYGAPGKDGRWNGMIGELINGKADMAVAPLTITHSREEVMDFTKPFMTLGISILFKRPEKKQPKLFGFLEPLHWKVWMYMSVAYLTVSVLLFVLARFSPYEWYNPHPCNQDSDLVENQFSLPNSLWFTIGSLMQQGCEVMPRATSTRLASGIWWFFTLVMISSYTANLAAFLTVARMVTPIENADDLSKQTEIKYGCQDSGSTKLFFKESKIPTYERMWSFMAANPDVFVPNSSTGINRVKQGKYAYLMESTMVEYAVERNCDLQQVGGLLDSKGYGIGTPRGSLLRDLLSSAILNLTEESQLHLIKDKWWKQQKCKAVVDVNKKSEASNLDTDTLGGVFVALMAGIGLGVLFCLLEFLWKRHQQSYLEQKSLCTAMWEQFMFAINILAKEDEPPPAAPLRKQQLEYKYLQRNGLSANPLLNSGSPYSGHSVNVPSGFDSMST